MPAADDMMISDRALARQQENGATIPSWPLKRTYALYMESNEESDDDDLPKSIEDVLTSIHSCYLLQEHLWLAWPLFIFFLTLAFYLYPEDYARIHMQYLFWLTVLSPYLYWLYSL
jgi:hypothetical protein